MVLTSSDFQLFLCRKKTSDLFKRLRWNDQVVGRSRIGGNWNRHSCEPMSIRRHHTHSLGSQLPENTVENRSTLFSRNRKGSVRDQLLKVSRLDPPAFIKANCWKRGKLVPGQTKKLELRAPAFQ